MSPLSTPRSWHALTRRAASAFALVALGSGAVSASANTLTNLAFTSNAGAFINNTIVDFASPLAFTLPSLGAPFLNNADSTLTLGYGEYYAYAFKGFGQHVGIGTISGVHDGGSFSAGASFPSDLATAAPFFSVSFANGDTLTIGTTGLTDDRIRIVADGAGMVPDGVDDAVYSVSYVAAVPEPGAAAMLLAGLGVLGMLGRRRRQP